MGFVKNGAVIGAGAILLFVGACGTDEGADSSDAAASNPELRSSCSLAVNPAMTLNTQIGAYNMSGDQSKLVVEERYATDEALTYVTAPEVKDLAKRSVSINADFNSAKDDAARNRAAVQQADTLDAILDVCRSSMEEAGTLSVYETYSAGLRKGVSSSPERIGAPASTSATPKTLTPDGSKVTMGDAVNVEFPDTDGKKRAIALTVVRVDKGSDDDIAKLSDDTRKKVGQLVYVRAKAEPAPGTVVPTGFEPTYTLTTSDGSDVNRITVIGDFEPCENKTGRGGAEELCATFVLTSKTAKVTEVTTEKLGYARTGSVSGRFTWKAK